MAEASKTITIHYVKSSQCRNLVVQGVFGGMNPANGQFHMATFVERPAIPQEIAYTDTGVEVSRSGKDGVVREIDAVLHYDINTALALSQWLNSKIEEFFKAHPEVRIPEQNQ